MSTIYSSDSDEIIPDSFSRSKSKGHTVDLTIESSGAEADESIIIRKPGTNRTNIKTKALISSDESDADSDPPARKSMKNRSTKSNIQRLNVSSDDEEENASIGNLDITARRSVERDDVTSDDSDQDSTRYEETDDDSEEEEEVERRALSPRTRMSMTGIRPKDMDTSSEIESDDEDNESEANNLSPRNKMSIAGETSKAEISEEKSASFKSAQNDSEEMELHSYNAEAIDPVSTTPAKQKSPKMRYTNMFNQSIRNKLSSTATIEEADLEESDSLILLSPKKPEVIELGSSTEEDQQPLSNPLIQPKITAVPFDNQTKYVSQDYYDKELKKLEELKSELQVSEKLLLTIAMKLPDGGKQIQQRVQMLKTEILKKDAILKSYKIEEGSLRRSTEIKNEMKSELPNQIPDWNALANDVNRIQPTHTGKQGLATFNNQKALTVETLKEIHGSLATCPAENVLADDPKGLKVTLMDHQKHALAWMTWRENQKPRGGILADDMGLGKTLTMISLIILSNWEDENKENESEESDESDDNDDWSTKKRKDYYKGGTLIVCPASLILQWEKEASQRVKRDVLSVYVHHGNNRESKPRHLRKYDMVVTTYNICSREAKFDGTLFGIKWKRVILDEAHVIRNHKSQMCVGVCQLKSKFRWALTGTPIQNKEMDLYSLLKFLRCSPFDDLTHWKKWIDNKSAGGQQRLNTLMKSLMLRRTKAQLQEKGALESLPNKETILINVELEKEEMNVYQKIMVFSKTLFAQYLHQRAERNNDMYYRSEGNKPTYMQTKDPNGAYHKLHEKFSRMHNEKGEIKSSEILVLLLRLRQICCHPGLIDAMLEDDIDNTTEQSVSEHSQSGIDLLEQLQNLEINEGSEAEVLMEEMDKHPDEDKMARASAKVLMRSNRVFNLQRPSSKMIKVIKIFEERVLSTGDKAIIISQWTSVLNILKTHLSSKGIPSLSLDGTVAVKDRQKIVNEVNDPKSNKKVLFLSLTAGGVGLNLVGANHLFLIDLHWNPQLEAQAQDRIYRVGQKKDVYIYKFMCTDTVEERIKALQDKKLALAEGVLTGSKTTGSKLTIEDLKSLFNM